MILRVRREENKVGEITISGAKNSALPIICSAIICDEDVVLENIPDIIDVRTLLAILSNLGLKYNFHNNTLSIKNKKKLPYKVLCEEVNKMRGSYYFMGAMLAKQNKIMITNSGGCNLGHRPINFHLEGFKKMGASVFTHNNFIKIKAKKMKPTNIHLEFPSVGATINLMMAAVKTQGITNIYNCAMEPEVIDVATFLNTMGANIVGAGTKKITIIGVSHLHGCKYKIICDRIEAGTYLILGALLDGAILHGLSGNYLRSLINVLRSSGYPVTTTNNTITINKIPHPSPFNITIGPYPAFPTDLGQPLSVLATQIPGTSIIKETIFTNRYSHVPELNKMGAKISVANNNVIIDGKTKLNSGNFVAHDLRGAASLVLAASLNNEDSTISNIETFLRGYENPTEKLASFGIKAQLVE
ncbi:MAG TPA: UDP-N-acetylglucosamine 1-carboxyvinyltransferase [Acholeplasmataceae bacterium]|nr:UDP-N-acetylglucosamine 1-carboxyvinyltransferase [Acholeplasmataceae bacterium]